MIQRIQSVYLSIIAILAVVILYLPLAVFQVGDQLLTFDASGVSASTAEGKELINPTWSLFALAIIIAIVALVTIFLFKKRMLQIRLCIFNGLLMLGFYGLFAFLLFSIKGDLSELSAATVSLKFAVGLPLISLILDYLAIRGIGADEALVRSLDRLR